MSSDDTRNDPLHRDTVVRAEGSRDPNVLRARKDEAPQVEVSVEDKEGQGSKATILYLLYLLYRTNFISRMNLKALLAEVGEKPPKEIAKYLVEEAAKGG